MAYKKRNVESAIKNNERIKQRYHNDPVFRQRCLDRERERRRKAKEGKPPRERVVKVKCSSRAEYLREWRKVRPENVKANAKRYYESCKLIKV